MRLRCLSCLLSEVEIADGRGPALAGRLDSVESYNSATYRGGILRLYYARALAGLDHQSGQA